MSAPIVIAAGGTGGHFFPAEALARVLIKRGHTVVLMTDQRAGIREDGVFANGQQFVLPGAGIAGRGIARSAKAVMALTRGIIAARSIVADLKPAAVVGFGGYPSVPPILGARLMGRSRPALVLHEGNAVLGKANALLARFADYVATSFPTVAKLPPAVKSTVTGMPVRSEIAELYDEGYTPPDVHAGCINLLIWGGSLGARVFSDIMPTVLNGFPAETKARFHITQQARAEDQVRVRDAYANAGISATVAPFFSDVPDRLRHAHLVIGRAGGSSVAELTMAGRPGILVPLPIAAGDEQGANARALSDAGAAWLVRQPDFTVEFMTQTLQKMLAEPAILASAAKAAASLAHPRAAQLLADVVEQSLHCSASRVYPTAQETENTL